MEEAVQLCKHGSMLTSIRWITGHLAMLPFVLLFHIFSALFGKRAAKKYIGNLLTGVSEIVVGFGIPKIGKSEDFPEFKKKIIRNFRMYKLLYDVKVEKEDEQSVEFRILNCPFTSALKNYGAAELCRFACAGDFRIAHKNRDKWQFKRTHSNGTDGKCCDHTYYSLVSTIEDKEGKNEESRVEKRMPQAQTTVAQLL